MQVRGLALPIERPNAGFCERLSYYWMDQLMRQGWKERDGRTFGDISEAQARQAVAYTRRDGFLPPEC